MSRTTNDILEALLDADDVPRLLELYESVAGPVDLEGLGQTSPERPMLSYVRWRVEAGPPGHALPEPAEVARRIAASGIADASDIGALVLLSHELPADPLHLADHIAAWFAAAPLTAPHMAGAIGRAVLVAYLAAGAPDRTNSFIETVQARDLAPTPELADLQALMSGLDAVGDRSTSTALRLVALELWARYKLPSLPDLAADIDTTQIAPEDLVVIAESRVVAPESPLAQGARRLLLHAAVVALDDHPTVREFRRLARGGAALVDGEAPSLTLPDGLELWVRTARLGEDAEPARLAAWALYKVGRLSAKSLATILFIKPHLDDLKFLQQHASTEELRAKASELDRDLAELSPDVASALLSFILDGLSDEQILTLRTHLKNLHEQGQLRGYALMAAEDFLELDADFSRAAEAAEAEVEGFFDQVSQLTGALSPSSTDTSTIERLLGRVERTGDSPEFFDLVLGRCGTVDPWVSLLASLVCHRWTGSEPNYHVFALPFAAVATEAIYRLGALPLYRLRETLLTEIIENSTGQDLPEPLCRRGTTRATLATFDSSLVPAAEGDFDQAAALAQRHGLPDLEVWALASHLQLRRNTGRRGDVRSAQLLERLSELAPIAKYPLAQAHIHAARADAILACAENDDPAAAREAIIHLRAAASAVDASTMLGQQARERLVQELAHFGTVEERREALELAREIFKDRLHPESEELSAGAHFTLAVALLANHRATTEVVAHLDEALNGYSRAGNQGGVQETRRLLAEHYLSIGDTSGGVPHAEIALQVARDRSDAGGIYAAAVLLLGLSSRGPHDPRIAGALRDLPEALRVRLRVHQALALARGNDPIDQCLPALHEYLESRVPADPATKLAAIGLAHNHPELLPDSLLEAALEWAERADEPVLRARLLIHQGRVEEACAVLRVLRGDSSHRQRWVSASILLLAALPDGAEEEQARICDEVEPFLDFNAPGEAHALFDLAQGLVHTANHDPGRLHRAWQAAVAAARHLPPELQPESLRQRWTIRAQQHIAEHRESSERTAQLAEWLADADRPPGEVDEHLLSSAFSLLLFGRLTHPRCVTAAKRLLQRVQESSGRAGFLWHRVAWIRGKVDAIPTADGPRLPYDDAPQWLIALVQGEEVQGEPTIDADGLELAGRTLQIRQDRADAILDWLTTEGRGCDADALHRMVTSWGDRVAKPKHLEKIQGLRKNKSFVIAMEEFQAQYSTGAWGDGTGLQRSAERLIELAISPDERVKALQAVGIERMSAYKAGAGTVALTRARDVLSDAVTLLRGGAHADDVAVSVMVSAGNAWRLGDDADADRSLAYYHEAEAIGPSAEHYVGQLHKVIADALLLRGRTDDIAQARHHIGLSLEARREGPLRMETLLTAAEVDLADASVDRASQLRRALHRFEEALTLCQDREAHAIARERILPVAGELFRLDPTDPIATRVLDHIVARVPALKEDVAAARRGSAPIGDPATVDSLHRLIRNPAWHACTAATQDLGREHVIDPRLKERAERAAARLRDRASPPAAELYERVRGLEAESDPGRLPGALVACAVILSYLAGLGEKVAERANAVAERAEVAIAQVEERDARVFLKLELSRVWAPSEQNSNPTQDFRRAAELLAGALAELEPDAALYVDVMLRHARATRYRTDGKPGDHLRRAEELYKEALLRARARGDELSANQILLNLQELSVALRRGGELQSLIQSVSATQEIADWSGGSSYVHLGGLARDLTLLGCKLRGPEAIDKLNEGQRVYERLFAEHRLERGIWEDAKNYQVMGAVELALRAERFDDALALWRERLAAQGDKVSPSRRGVTLHNLADTLIVIGRSFDEAAEAIQLGEEALKIRIGVGDPEHLWETHHLLGDAARCALNRRSESRRTGGELTQVWTRGRKAYQAAIQQARGLGGGERLVRSGVGLGLLALEAPQMSMTVDTAEAAWSAIDEGRRVLLYNEHYASQELQLATALTERVLEMASRQDVEGHLGGSRGMVVARWLLRAAGSQQRRLGARWRRPAGVTDEVWEEWVRALKSQDDGEIGRVAELLQQGAPFLSGEAGLGGLERWLAQNPASAAVVVLPGHSGYLAAVVTLEDGDAVVTSQLLAGEVGGAPVWSTLFVDDEPFTTSAYSDLLDRVKRRVVQPVRQMLPRGAKYLLWHGSGALRLLSPHDLWTGFAVTTALDFGLSGAVEPLHARTAIIVADPDTARERIPGGVEAAVRLGALVEEPSRVRLRLSRGARYGAQLQLAVRGLIDAPADPEGVLEDIKECSRLVLMCHGGFTNSGDPVLYLVDENGDEATLDLHRVASDPRAFVGATVILLACSVGRASAENHKVAGLPGVFLACGARRVVAPLWPVYVRAAKDIGAALLTALERRRRLDEALFDTIEGFRRNNQIKMLSSARAFVVYEA